MKKTWSISTTLRNPNRLRNFLMVLKELEGELWNKENQLKYQILLIKNRIYGYGSQQFYNGLSKSQIDLIENTEKEISYKTAEKIFLSKNYEDPAMRGRQSLNPLKKIGLVSLKNKKITITKLGYLFLEEDFDLSEIFFRSFIKWQIPNPDSKDYKIENGYNVKPFIGVLHLIKKVSSISEKKEEKQKGISKDEFCLFAQTLVNHKDIENHANKIINLRSLQKNKTKQEKKEIFENYKIQFLSNFLNTNDNQIIQSFYKNLSDYADNSVRYFRLTKLIYLRGNGFYIDLELRRKIEIEELLKNDNAKSLNFSSKDKYLDYIADIEQPKLPWETKNKLKEIIQNLLLDIEKYEKATNTPSQKATQYFNFDEKQLKDYIVKLRIYRRQLQDKENHQKSGNLQEIEKYIGILKSIYDYENRPVLLEKYATLGLNALNDALKIKANYPVGDDNEPTFTAPANTPDIECFYQGYNAICEVTMLTNRSQWYNEGQPVMRHLRDFEKKHNQKPSYCLFISPKFHRDTINTFWNAVKYEYEGEKQKIVPLTINNFVELLKTLLLLKKNNKSLSYKQLSYLYDAIIENTKQLKKSDDWIKSIPIAIENWKKEITR